MASRELVVLGTASQVPTRHRNHNAYLLRWDTQGILFDPGEGAQRQFTFAGVSPATTTRICITHFHGDHCLGLPGVVMRLGLDQGHLPVPIHYPASGQQYFDRLITATAGQESLDVDARPIAADGPIYSDDTFTLSAARLRHRVDAVGYRLHEPDGRRMLPDLLADAGVVGPDIGRLQREGSLEVEGRTVTLESVSEHRTGQTFAFEMDSAWCQAAIDLAADADLLVCEATFLSSDEEAATEYGHLTAGQAGRLAREAGVGTLVLSHFSARYADVEPFADEAEPSSTARSCSRPTSFGFPSRDVTDRRASTARRRGPMGHDLPHLPSRGI